MVDSESIHLRIVLVGDNGVVMAVVVNSESIHSGIVLVQSTHPGP